MQSYDLGLRAGGPDREHTIEICRFVGRRLYESAVSPDWVRNAGWSLAGGGAGVALALEWLDRCLPSEKWDLAAKNVLTKSVERAADNVEGSTSNGLFGGLAGLGFAAMMMARGQSRYQKLVGRIHDQFVDNAIETIGQLRNRSDFAAADYDLVSGVSGIGVYALQALHLPKGQQLFDDSVKFFSDPAVGTNLVTRFFTPQPLIASSIMAHLFPRGYLDCGMAHGVAGPLAFLSIARLSGYKTLGLDNAIDSFAACLDAQAIETKSGSLWPSAIELSPEFERGTPARAAWCYGNPGVARSLWLGGCALRRPALCKRGSVAMANVFRRPRVEWEVLSPTFCHGLSGVLQITRRFANDTRDARFAEKSDSLMEDLLCSFHPDFQFGFRDVQANAARDSANLLEGAAGILLVLLSATFPIEPTWDRIFLLS